LSEPKTKLDPTQRFSDRVLYYVRSRPPYPREILDLCRSDLGLRPEHQIADIGSGTGFLSDLFLQNGNTVFCVEPNDAMRRAAEKRLAGLPNFRSVSGTAEQTGLAGATFDFVTSGQAFHWFDRNRAREEFQRLLRPNGWVLLIWNEREKEPNSAGFDADYDAVVKEFEIDRQHVRHLDITARGSQALADFYGPRGFQVKTFDNPQKLDLDKLISRIFSASYMPLPGRPGADRMLQRIRDIFRTHARDGYVVQRYTTKVYYGRLN
jgi:SAM-dependent methyltransferase